MNPDVLNQTKILNDLQNNWKPLVLMIPLRLGLSHVNIEYINQLKVKSFSEKLMFFNI